MHQAHSRRVLSVIAAPLISESIGDSRRVLSVVVALLILGSIDRQLWRSEPDRHRSVVYLVLRFARTYVRNWNSTTQAEQLRLRPRKLGTAIRLLCPCCFQPGFGDSASAAQ